MSNPGNDEGEEFDVGGVRLPRPFKLLRLGHFGVNVSDPEAARDFYCRLLGFRLSDPIDFNARLPEAERGKHGPGIGYFTRHGGDHHSFVLFPRRIMEQVNPHYRKHPELGDFLAVPQAKLLPERRTLAELLLPVWAARSERGALPGARRALERVLRDDYLRGLKRGLASERASSAV